MNQNEPASFRDPSGFLFRSRDGVLYRQINTCYERDYRRFMDSGLYGELSSGGLLVEHEEAPVELGSCGACAVIRPRPVSFISYPYEWSFSELQDAALLTLDIQRRAIEKGMWLKDASAYNVQFNGARPVFIDTLSFEQYPEGEPWVAYGQFCRHFLAPLALMAKVDVRLSDLLRTHLDGVPLDLAAPMLPWSTRLNPGLLMHLHLHAKAQVRVKRDERSAGVPPASEESASQSSKRGMTLNALRGLTDSLSNVVSGLSYLRETSTWDDYYDTNTYTNAARAEKERFVAECLDHSAPGCVWDLGANTGVFSRLASRRGIYTVAFDLDWLCVERNYRAARQSVETDLLPLRLDLSNPSPAQGWAHEERHSLVERGPADLVMALALVHHLAIANNVPLPAIAEFMGRTSRSLVIEFVPKEDPQVQRLLRARKDVFDTYTRQHFEEAFAQHFNTLASRPVPDSARVLYFMEKKR